MIRGIIHVLRIGGGVEREPQSSSCKNERQQVPATTTTTPVEPGAADKSDFENKTPHKKFVSLLAVEPIYTITTRYQTESDGREETREIRTRHEHRKPVAHGGDGRCGATIVGSEVVRRRRIETNHHHQTAGRACRDKRDGSVRPGHRQTVIVPVGGGGDQDGGGRTAFRVRQHGSRFRRDRQARKAVTHTHIRVHTRNEGGSRTTDERRSGVRQRQDRGRDPDQRADRQQRGRVDRRDTVQLEKEQPHAQVRDSTGAEVRHGGDGQGAVQAVFHAGARVQVPVGRRPEALFAGVQRLVHGHHQPGTLEPHGSNRDRNHPETGQVRHGQAA
eukprot:XP_016662730.1 PREDICTED: uncharacterized protein LOC107884650 [Acyrthosiphon pisum]